MEESLGAPDFWRRGTRRRISSAASSCVIGIAGGSCSGKTALSRALQELAGVEFCALLHMDSYYKIAAGGLYREATHSFESPAAIDINLLVAHIDALTKGVAVKSPRYDRRESQRQGFTEVSPKELLVVEGLSALHFPELRSRCHFSVFLDLDCSTRMKRRLARDTIGYGLPLERQRRHYLQEVEPAYWRIVEPSRRYADVVLSGRVKPSTNAARLLRRLDRESVS